MTTQHPRHTLVKEQDAVRILGFAQMTPMRTFADMLQVNREVREALELPLWLKFLLPYERRDQATLTPSEQSRFLCAYDVINANGTLGALVDIHAQMHMQHTNARLLPWHRIFLLVFEQALRAVHPDVTVPYWDWTQPGEESVPPWLTGVTPTVVTPTRTINVTRSPGTTSDLAMIASNVPSILAMDDFDDFAANMNGVHGGVHIWVGGSMSLVSDSPADPIFWMHHGNLDRLWWVWQNDNPGENPPLSGADAILDPWTYTEPDTRDIEALGYTYV